jgi:transcriptional regulator with XRE-family HTH domain
MSIHTTHADLGRAIRRLRRARRLTIEDLAFTAGMHHTYLSQIERGLRNPTLDKLYGVARALDVPLSTLLALAEEEAAVAQAARAARTQLRAFAGTPPIR